MKSAFQRDTAWKQIRKTSSVTNCKFRNNVFTYFKRSQLLSLLNIDLNMSPLISIVTSQPRPIEAKRLNKHDLSCHNVGLHLSMSQAASDRSLSTSFVIGLSGLTGGAGRSTVSSLLFGRLICLRLLRGAYLPQYGPQTLEFELLFALILGDFPPRTVSSTGRWSPLGISDCVLRRLRFSSSSPPPVCSYIENKEKIVTNQIQEKTFRRLRIRPSYNFAQKLWELIN